MSTVQPTPFSPYSQTKPSTRTTQTAHSVFQGPKSQDVLHFGNSHPVPNIPNATTFSTGEKWKGGGKALLKSISNWKWWAKEGAIACLITLATCWLPGSQLFTIPLWLLISGAYTHGRAFYKGFKNPDAVNQKALEKDSALKKFINHNSRAGLSNGQIAKALAKGAWDNGKRAFTYKNGDLLQNLGISALLTLATCWMPGSQLLTIPAWFCIDAAIKAYMGASYAWNAPRYYLSNQHRKT